MIELAYANSTAVDFLSLIHMCQIRSQLFLYSLVTVFDYQENSHIRTGSPSKYYAISQARD